MGAQSKIAVAVLLQPHFYLQSFPLRLSAPLAIEIHSNNRGDVGVLFPKLISDRNDLENKAEMV